MNVKVICLRHGGSILGSFEEYDDYILLKKPVEVIIKQNEEDDFFVSFIPFLHYTEEYDSGVKISKNDIFTITNPLNQIIEHYMQCVNYKKDE